MYAVGNPIRYNDPSGHCFDDPVTAALCVAMAYVATAIYVSARTMSAQPVGNNASNIWQLMKLGAEHADHANITGEGLQSLENDPSVQDAEGRITAQIKSDPKYEEQSFSPKTDPSPFTADGPSRNFVTGLLTGNPAFLMVHSANLYATNTKVSANGTITTTWEVSDNFDYLPDWNNHQRPHYWEYNIGATLSYPIYYGFLRAKPQVPTTAEWNQTILPTNSCGHCR
jgi:hypothetical protein